MDELIAAVRALQNAQADWNRHTSTYSASYQMDEPLTPGERRADEQIRHTERVLRDKLTNAREKMIALAIKEFGWDNPNLK